MMEDDSFMDRLCAADNFDDQIEREVMERQGYGKPQIPEIKETDG